MNEIKMSDAFELPVKKKLFSHYNWLWSDAGLSGSYADFNSVGQLEASIVAINNHDRLVEENERLSVIASDRQGAVKLMSKSWRHVADTDNNLMTRYVEMAERQFKTKDAEIESLTDIATQKSTRCDELYEALELMLEQFGEPDGSDFTNEADYQAVKLAKVTLDKSRKEAESINEQG